MAKVRKGDHVGTSDGKEGKVVMVDSARGKIAVLDEDYPNDPPIVYNAEEIKKLK